MIKTKSKRMKTTSNESVTKIFGEVKNLDKAV